MKNVFFLLPAVALILSGSGILSVSSAKAATTPPVAAPSKESSASSTSLREIIIPDQLVSDADASVFKNITTQLKRSKLLEIDQPGTISFSSTDVGRNQPVRYFKLGDMYLMLSAHPGSLSLATDFSRPAENTGIWYASSSTAAHWQPLTVLSNSSWIQNNPFYLWSSKGKLNLLAIDGRGAGSGEGLAKVLTSSNGGANWKITRCFYYGGNFPALVSDTVATRKNFSTLLNRYLQTKQSSGTPTEYRFNPRTGNYEGRQKSKVTGKTETFVEEACKDIQ